MPYRMLCVAVGALIAICATIAPVRAQGVSLLSVQTGHSTILQAPGLERLAVGGGVSANQSLRAALEQMVKEEGAELFIPPMKLCTDNAAMAAIAVEKWRQRQWATLDLDAVAAYSGT